MFRRTNGSNDITVITVITYRKFRQKLQGGKGDFNSFWIILYIGFLPVTIFKNLLRVWLSNNVNASGIIMIIILIINRKHNYSVFQTILKNRGNKTLYKMW